MVGPARARLLLGLALDRLFPIGVAGAVIPRSARAVIGGALVVAAAWPMARALLRFRFAGTPSEPWKPTTALVVRGIYKRTRNPVWTEYNCSEGNAHVFIGNEGYLMSADGYLMPTRKGQQPPDPRYFRDTAK